MKLRKKHVAIILALGMVLTSTGPILADQVTSPGVELYQVTLSQRIPIRVK